MYSKVQPIPLHLHPCWLLLLVAVWMVSGCSKKPERPPTPASRFGDTYRIILNRAPADPDRPPALTSDSLQALITYPGGCEDHTFALRHRVARDTARLWIRHDAHGDTCTVQLFDRVQLHVPAPARDPATIVLLNPEGGPPFLLRLKR